MTDVTDVFVPKSAASKKLGVKSNERSDGVQQKKKKINKSIFKKDICLYVLY